MAIIPIKQVDTNIRTDPVVLDDPTLATANNSRRMLALQNVQAFTESLQENRRKAEEADAFNKSTTEAELDYSNRYIEMQTASRLNPDGAADSFQKYISDDIQRRIDTAPSGIKQQLENQLSDKLVRYSTRAQTWENNTRLELIQNSAEQQLKLREEIAARTTSVDDANRLYEEGLAAIDSLRGVLPDENLVVKRDQLQGKIFGRAAEALVISDPVRASSEFRSGKWDGYLNEVQKAKAIQTADSRLKTLQDVSGQKLKPQMKIAIAQVENFNAPIPMEMVNEVTNTLGEEEGNKFLSRLLLAKETSQIIGQTHAMTPDQIVTMKQDMEKQLANPNVEEFDVKLRQYNKFLQAAESVRQFRLKDGYSAAAQSLGISEPTPQDILAEQTRLGIPPQMLAPQQSQALVAALEQTGSVDERMRLLDQVGQRFSRKDGTTQIAFNDMRKAGLDPQYWTVAMMDPQTDAKSRRLALQVIDTSLSDIKQQIPEDKAEDLKDALDQVETELKPFTRSFLDTGGNVMRAYTPTFELAKKMAATQLTRGISPEDAASEAVKFITDSYSLVNQGAGVFSDDDGPYLRIPKQINNRALSADVVTRTLEKKKDFLVENFDLIANNTDLPDDNYKDMIENQAYWVTNQQDSGATLFVGQFPVVMEQNGVVTDVSVNFEDVLDGAVTNKRNDVVEMARGALSSNNRKDLKKVMRLINKDPKRYGFLRQSVEEALGGL